MSASPIWQGCEAHTGFIPLIACLASSSVQLILVSTMVANGMGDLILISTVQFYLYYLIMSLSLDKSTLKIKGLL